ncbi:MAG: endolytic transglycosylase MltG [Methylocystaceae bacterium]|nr:MAG: endolytic transglycosylase MltG [Methylocystaceae bacterium]
MSDAPDGRAEDPRGDQDDSARESVSRFFRRRASLQSPKQSLQPEAPPPPPPRSKRREGALSALSGFLSFLLVLAVACVIGLVAILHKLREPGPLAAEKIVYIAPRSDVPEILARLEREGVIDNPLLMNIALLVEGGRSKLKPGEYLFKQNASLREVMDELVNGRQILHGVTIPEGLTTEQIVARLRDSDVLAGDVTEIPKEGALLPETYKVARGYPRAKLVAKMQEDQRRLLDQIWARRARDLPVKTPYELVTLASIVEKETGRADERPRVAAVFVNRLRKGMRLQSDPTIVYGLVGGKATLGRGILKSELDKWTPYNTYAIDGLPPGPIANPGKAALEAVANPSHTQELYFVADGAGGHSFSETLEQHQRNVQRWRQLERDQKDKGAAEIDRLEPGATITPPQQPARDKRGDAGRLSIGRLVGVNERREDYPRGLAMSPDHSVLKRLGAFLPGVPEDYAGDNETALRLTSRRGDARRQSHPIFTTEFAQRLRAESIFGALLADATTDPDSPADEASELADGGSLESLAPGAYPVSARLLADQKARAAKLGLAPTPDDPPTESRTALNAAPSPATSALIDRGRVFDASEGTALDPLRDRSWDLTSPKNVPNVTSYR